ncbi:MAG: glutamyl-tRNA reductase [Fusobacterium gastrosuis]|uniref:glutamyl-tRNA reductase n=1 Tax=Fusobacterium TaxID=848 RepID=UPI001F501A13|nr:MULTISPECIES: glutamyl-tRNA reductase [Fusobacterium]MDD7410267.1 glutamyl-tRNA reductase [Fusobacteriaceae bacterium]MCI5725673.1 glutamyl-tRNA reductase [Fusobacterium sp.]MDY4010950.1 glutamyl-tRNA reductase [Fusobacterium gastrosuis]MDY5306547.1 glutamyl-tRNA reductase [Fusobacterium gastrosuis]MDY5712567.1 glutamyl-tRNA reductase [Fusobacterium gastrosuis]
MLNLEKFLVIGVSHEHLSLEEREVFMKTRPKNIIENLFKENRIKSYINLSTCLRIEFYLELNEDIRITEIEKLFNIKNIYVKKSMEAVDYLFKLSCGFYSVIKGEDQILAQVKVAHSEALENNHSSKLVNIVFNKAIELGKKFRTVSNIAHNALSLEAISLRFIKSKFDDIKNKNIFILGIGDLSQDILKILVKEELKNIYITNRTYHTAEQIKDKFPSINLVDYKEKYKGLVKADIIISATSAPHYVVEYEKFVTDMDRNKEYLFLDLAVPRDVDERLIEHKNINICNLDDIWKVYNENTCNRDKLLEEYSYLIAEQKEKLLEKIESSLKYA